VLDGGPIPRMHIVEVPLASTQPCLTPLLLVWSNDSTALTHVCLVSQKPLPKLQGRRIHSEQLDVRCQHYMIMRRRPFPGHLLTQCATPRTVQITDDGLPWVLLTDKQSRQKRQTDAKKAAAKEGEQVPNDSFPRFVSIKHVRNCLHSHYIGGYNEHLRLRSPALFAGLTQADIDELHFYGDANAHRRTQALQSDAAKRVYASLSPTLRLYDTLMLAGETYGSMCGRNGNASYVAIAFKPATKTSDSEEKFDEEVDEEAVPFLWYGQVSYYVSHTFNGKEHQFAVMRFYDWVGEGRWDKQRPALSLDEAMHHRYNLTSAIARQTYQDFPLVTRTFTNSDILDVVPVQRLAFRWIPGMHTDGKSQYVCPIPTRVHA
jgi:hypothetical protein